MGLEPSDPHRDHGSLLSAQNNTCFSGEGGCTLQVQVHIKMTSCSFQNS